MSNEKVRKPGFAPRSGPARSETFQQKNRYGSQRNRFSGPPSKRRHSPKFLEEEAVVIDFRPEGLYGEPLSDNHPSHPLAYMVGTKYFILFAAIFRQGIELKRLDHVPLQGNRDLIALKRKRFSDLPVAVQQDLENVIVHIVESNPEPYIEFFNKSGLATSQKHQLQLLHGIGPKRLELILTERAKSPFTDFEDIKKRTHLANPIQLVAKRIIEEISEPQKFYLFAKAYKPEER